MTLVPVDHQPEFGGGYSLVPIDHNPFSSDVAQPASQPDQSRDLSPADQAAMQPETFANPYVRGLIDSTASLPRRAIENSQNALDTGTYDPSVPVETALTMMGTGGISGVPLREGEAALGSGIRTYRNVPDSLMGYRKSGPQKGFDETNYPHTQDVEVTLPATASTPQETFQDSIRGMNADHAVERAYRNWPDALHITPVARRDAADMTLGSGATDQKTGALITGVNQGIRAYHGSPHDFDAFDLSKIGTGEGAQAYGHGLYFAENPKVAEGYRNTLADWKVDGAAPNPNDPSHIAAVTLKAYNGNPAGAIEDLTRTATVGPEAERGAAAQAIQMIQNGNKLPEATGGRMYEVNINADPAHFLDWDKPLSEQHLAVREKLTPEAMGLKPAGPLGERGYYGYVDDKGRLIGRATTGRLPEEPFPGSEMASSIARGMGTWKPDEGAAALQQAGIPGIKYLDQGSRAAGDGSRNYVVFNHDLIDIVRKYAAAGIALPPAIAAQYEQMKAGQAQPVPSGNYTAGLGL